MSELTGRAKGQAGQAKDQAGKANGPSAQVAAGADAESRAPQAAAEPTDIPALAEVSADDAVVRRTKDGWRVGDADVPDLTSAMVLADLISAELASPEEAVQPAAAAGSTGAGMGPDTATGAAASTGSDTGKEGRTATSAQTSASPQTATAASAPTTAPALTATASAAAAQGGGAPEPSGKGKAKGKSGRSKDPAPSDTNRLRTTIGQLEHALTARIRVEQAIGVLAERHRIQPRQAFEQLRSAARSRGRRVIDIASDVVASATNPLLQLPDELSRPRTGGRQARRGRQTPTILGSE